MMEKWLILIRLRFLNEVRPAFRREVWDPRRTLTCGLYTLALPLVTAAAISLGSFSLLNSGQSRAISLCMLALIALMTVVAEFYRASAFSPEARLFRSVRVKPLLGLSYFVALALFRGGFAFAAVLAVSLVIFGSGDSPVAVSQIIVVELAVVVFLTVLGVFISILLRRTTDWLRLSPHLAWGLILPAYFLGLFVGLSTILGTGSWRELMGPRFLGMGVLPGRVLELSIRAGSQLSSSIDSTGGALCMLLASGVMLYVIHLTWSSDLLGSTARIGSPPYGTRPFRCFSRRLSVALFQKDCREVWRDPANRIGLGIVGLLLLATFIGQYRRLRFSDTPTKALVISVSIIILLPMLLTGRSVVSELGGLTLYRRFRIGVRRLFRLKLVPQISLNVLLGLVLTLPFLAVFWGQSTEIEICVYFLALFVLLPNMTALVLALAVLFPVGPEGNGPLPLSGTGLVVYFVVVSLASGALFAIHDVALNPEKTPELVGFGALLLSLALSGPLSLILARSSVERSMD